MVDPRNEGEAVSDDTLPAPKATIDDVWKDIQEVLRVLNTITENQLDLNQKLLVLREDFENLRGRVTILEHPMNGG